MNAASHSLPTRIASIALLLTLAACGGGGSSVPSAANVEVTAANQDAVSRAGMVAVQGGSIGGSLGLSSNSPASPLAAVVRNGARRALLAAAGRKSIAAVLGPRSTDCAVSGSASATLNDRDNSLGVSVGDTLTVSFNNCSDVAGSVLSGTMSATYTQVVTSPSLAVGASVVVSSLSATETGYSAVLDGGFALAYSQPSASVETTRITVGNSLSLQATTPVYGDTITLRSGYFVEDSHDVSAVPPEGGAAGRTTSTASGQVASAAGGGYVQVQTLDPIVQYDIDDFPRSGRLQAVGKTGALQAVILSATQVRIELDVGGDGTYEATKTVAWTQLL